MKIKQVLFLVALLPSTLFAQIRHAPANFQTPDGYGIFVDFKKADYN